MSEQPTVRSTYDHTGPPGVRAQCPECEQEGLYSIPQQLHSNVPGNFPVTCANCGKEFQVDPSSPAEPDLVH